MGHILLVDDHQGFRKVVSTALAMRGHRVVEAEHGGAALSALRQKPADLILLDLAMPKLNGIEFLRAIEADPGLRSIPVIVVSAVAEAAAMVANAGGEVERFSKSNLSLERLLARVHDRLGERDAGPLTTLPAGAGSVAERFNDAVRSASDNRRDGARHRWRASAIVQIIDPGTRLMIESLHVSTLDLSTGGFSFVSRRYLHVGAELIVRLATAKRPLTLRGVVRSCALDGEGRHRVGVEFIAREDGGR